MVCQLCVENETCPDHEKYPADIVSTPPNRYGDPPPFFDFRSPGTRFEDAEKRIAQLETDVHNLKNQMQALMMKMEMMGK